MAETLTVLNKIASLLISVIYRMTVRLTVELLKLGCVLGLLCLFGGTVIFFLVFVGWSVYAHSDGSVLFTCIGILGAVTVVIVCGLLVQYVMRDVLKLTDMSLVEILGFLTSVLLNNVKRTKNSQDENTSVRQKSD